MWEVFTYTFSYTLSSLPCTLFVCIRCTNLRIHLLSHRDLFTTLSSGRNQRFYLSLFFFFLSAPASAGKEDWGSVAICTYRCRTNHRRRQHFGHRWGVDKFIYFLSVWRSQGLNLGRLCGSRVTYRYTTTLRASNLLPNLNRTDL